MDDGGAPLVKDGRKNDGPEHVGAAGEEVVVFGRVHPGERDPDVGEVLGAVGSLGGCTTRRSGQAGSARRTRAWAGKSKGGRTDAGAPERLLDDDHLGQGERHGALADG